MTVTEARSVRPLAAHLTRFVARLRKAGLPIGVDQTTAFAEALTLVQPLSPTQFRAAARATLVTRAHQLPLFETEFDVYWRAVRPRRPQKTPRAPRHRPNTRTSALVSFMAAAHSGLRREIELPDRSGTATSAETFQRKDFSVLTDEEHRALSATLAEMRWRFCQRRTRRQQRRVRGQQLDLREMVRRQARGDLRAGTLAFRGPKLKPRPLVLLADISGSMELYSRVVLQFFHGLSRAVPNAETFVFGTRLTRITDGLALRDVDRALDAVTDQVMDFAGGTRIGESLQTFHRRWSGRVLRRGAVVIIVSDGCEEGAPTLLAEQMHRLVHRCHRLIWLNPRLSQARYEPQVSGMSVALRYVDDFLPIGNLEALRGLARHLGELPRRPSRNYLNAPLRKGDIGEAQR